METTLEIINDGLKKSVRLYNMGETERDVTIDLINELESKGGYKTYTAIVNSGSEKFKTPDGYGLVCVGAHFSELNEKGNTVNRTFEIMAAFKL